MILVELETGATLIAAWRDLALPQRGEAPRPLPRVTHAYAGTTYSVQGRTATAAVFHVGSRTDARETYVAMTRHRSEAVMIVDAVRLLNEASPATHDLMLEATPDPNFRFAALVAEAERYDEKLNVRSFEERDRSRDIGIDYGPDLSL